MPHLSGVFFVFLYSAIALFNSFVVLQHLEPTKAFRSAQTISIGFKSGDWAGDSHLLELITITFHSQRVTNDLLKYPNTFPGSYYSWMT